MMSDATKRALATHLSLGFTAQLSSDEHRRYLAELVRRDIAASNSYAKDVAEWCGRALAHARQTGNFEARPFVQNAELIIAALHAYAHCGDEDR